MIYRFEISLRKSLHHFAAISNNYYLQIWDQPLKISPPFCRHCQQLWFHGFEISLKKSPHQSCSLVGACSAAPNYTWSVLTLPRFAAPTYTCFVVLLHLSSPGLSLLCHACRTYLHLFCCFCCTYLQLICPILQHLLAPALSRLPHLFCHTCCINLHLLASTWPIKYNSNIMRILKNPPYIQAPPTNSEISTTYQFFFHPLPVHSPYTRLR